jgi:hypothetical protein
VARTCRPPVHLTRSGLFRELNLLLTRGPLAGITGMPAIWLLLGRIITRNSLASNGGTARVRIEIVNFGGPCNLKTRRHQRWTALLGLAAMLVALFVAPIVPNQAMAMPGQTHMAVADTGSMPCHQSPAKPCSDCPGKACLSIDACLAKCFQTIPLLPAPAGLKIRARGTRVSTTESLVTASSLIPPLLRPPSV